MRKFQDEKLIETTQISDSQGEVALAAELLSLRIQMKVLQKENKILNEAIKHTEEFCLCKRFKTYGFDYGEKHPKMGKATMGARWLTPRDFIKENIFEKKEIRCKHDVHGNDCFECNPGEGK